ncbi:MAG TPA: hypothetical protein VKV15_27880 [Bryobacteraceae bacterium]|nr:hypothetical protein [Bryobacteraceae bacterium]
MRGLLILLCCLAAVHGETIQERGTRVVKEALAALGGEHYLAMQNRVETGRAYSFYREDLSGLAIAKIYTEYLSPPKSPKLLGQRVRQAFGKNGEAWDLFLESGEGWDVTYHGARPLEQTLLDRYRDSTLHDIFYILRERWTEPGMIFESRGSDVVANQPVEIVDITDSADRVVTVSFHQFTKLPVKQVFYRRDPQTKDRHEESTVYSKYRDVGGGVMWPFTIYRERDGEKVYEMFSDSVEINQDFPDGMFSLPSGVKKIKPAE